MKTSPQGSWGNRRLTFLPFLTTVDTTNQLAVALFTTLTASTEIEGGVVVIHLWKIHLKYPSFILSKNYFALNSYQVVSATDTYIQKSGSVICHFGMSPSGVTSRASCLVEGIGHELFFVHSMGCFKQPFCKSLFFTCRKRLQVFCTLSL